MQGIIFACDSFKGTLSSFKVGKAVEVGLRHCFQSCAETEEDLSSLNHLPMQLKHRRYVHCPMSDGGGGLIDSVTYERDLGKRQWSVAPSFSSVCPSSSSNSFVPHPSITDRTSGSVSSYFSKVDLQRIQVPPEYPIHGPLGEIIKDRPVFFACDVKQRLVVVEMAEAAGLARILDPARRSPWEASSYGVGDILKYAMKYMTQESQLNQKDKMIMGGGVQGSNQDLPTSNKVTVLLGIGGSATNDGGLGALQSMGLAIYLTPSNESNGKESFRLKEPFAGKHLSLLHHIEITAELQGLFSSKKKEESTSDDFKCVIDKMFLICDVENPLVGPNGATFIFGPQKCSPVVEGGSGVEDAAVGTVKTAAQKEMLCQLEEGMKQAAKHVVESAWSQIQVWHQARELSNIEENFMQSLATFPLSTEGSDETVRKNIVKRIKDNLLHSPRGGGAGGMSGFFRYVLGTSCLPGGDIVASLQGLRVVEMMPWMVTPYSLDPSGYGSGALVSQKIDGKNLPFGLLFDDWDTLVTGEGSFDAQSIFSRKTVGKLLEMVIEANAWRWKRGHKKVSGSLSSSFDHVSPSLLKDVIVVCGRTGFHSPQEAMRALKSILLKKDRNGSSISPLLQKWMSEISYMIATPAAPLEKVLDMLIPQFRILVLTDHFTLDKAMKNPYECVVEVTKRTFGGPETFKQRKSFL